MADESDILESWEELNDNVLEQKLQDIKLSARTTNGCNGEAVTQLREESSRTQYAPQVKILQRKNEKAPTNAERARNLKGPQKSIQQREAEYNEARRRILGEGYTGADNTNNNATQPSPQQRPMKIVKPEDGSKMQTGKVQILRDPKGPDDTRGFDQHR
ncbi:SUZ domain-containing protein 1-like isoform X2 [Dreissena polymorpha]|uniref:SUZ domain-containing protein 1-like isoform X2 n=1 Tax=Dreissena polymorpha TaxID=45954 RepID=UPI002265102A|nr:SUZ domain-containing protein 1-like isoform X2 [Dreissena polymorpha]